ncbi:MAG: DUF6316 family protein [Cellvibrionaceae bacterium]
MISTRNRQGEAAIPHDRSERLSEHDNYWFFSTREGVQVGPFDSRAEAAEGVGEYIDFITGNPDPRSLTFLHRVQVA